MLLKKDYFCDDYDDRISKINIYYRKIIEEL